MADRPNNFGEVLLKAIGSTAEEAPSIFNNARTRKRAESLQMLNAMMQFQDAQREDQQLKMQQAQQQQQAQVAQANLAHINAETAKLQYEMSQPYRDWLKEKEAADLLAKNKAELDLWKQKMSYAQEHGINLAGNTPSGGSGGQFLLTPDDLVRRGQAAQNDKVGALDKQIQTLQWMPTKADEVAKLRSEREQIASPAWLNASLSAPSDSLGIPQFMINPNAQAPQTFSPAPSNNSYDFDAWGKQTFGAEWDKATPEKKQKAIAKRKLELGIQ